MSINDDRLAADVVASRSKGQVQRILQKADDLRSSYEQQLQVRDAAIEALAAENAMLRDPMVWLKNGELGTQAMHAADERGATEDEVLRESMAAMIAAIRCPDTDAFINAVRAEGLELAAKEADKWIGLDLLARELRLKAEKLRNGETS